MTVNGNRGEASKSSEPECTGECSECLQGADRQAGHQRRDREGPDAAVGRSGRLASAGVESGIVDVTTLLGPGRRGASDRDAGTPDGVPHEHRSTHDAGDHADGREAEPEVGRFGTAYVGQQGAMPAMVP